MDPMLLIMLALIAVLFFFMFRNNKKRQQQAQEMQSNLRPGAEVMIQSGIYGTVEEVDDDKNRVTLRSGTSTLVVHRNAIAQIITPVEGAADDESEVSDLAPDDDPEFGERVNSEAAEAESAAAETVANDAETGAENDADTDPNAPKA